MNKQKKFKQKYYFFLNPYGEYGFTKCPKCEGKTRVRKFLLVIMIGNKDTFNLNKQCKFCPYCELIIAKKSGIDGFLNKINLAYSLNKENYCVIGTLFKGYLKKCSEKHLLNDSAKEIFKKYFRMFRETLNFEPDYSVWRH